MTLQKIARILGVLLFLSLAGNILLGGLVSGRLYGGGGFGAGECNEWKKRNAELKEKLPPADYNILKADMSKHKEDMKAGKKKMDDARTVVENAMRAEPFDQKALDKALKDEQAIKRDVLMNMRAARDQIVPKLSPEGQKIFREMGHKAPDDDAMRPPRPPRDHARGDKPHGAKAEDQDADEQAPPPEQ